MLPESWIRRIFDAMRKNYGASLDRMWQAPAGVDAEKYAQELLNHWAHELRAYLEHPEALRYAIDHLPPGFPPDLPAFKQLCRDGMPREPVPALPPPRERTAAGEDVLHALARARRAAGGPRDWAEVLRQREASGTPLTPFQRAAHREALRAAAYADSDDDKFDWSERQEATARRVREYAQQKGLTL